MSQQTAVMRKKIDEAKAGDDKALDFLRAVIVSVATRDHEPETPREVIIEVAELILHHGLEQHRRDAEMN